MKVITATFLLLFSSCMNILNREDEASNKTRFTFQYCNQTLGAQFVESNCTKFKDTPLRAVRYCSECPNASFDLTQEGLIRSIVQRNMAEDEFLKYVKNFTSELGSPNISETDNAQMYSWTLRKQGISISLSKIVDKKNTDGIQFRLDIDDLKTIGF